MGAKKHLMPLLAPGVDPGILRGPISNLNALRCDVMAQLHQLVQDLAGQLGRETEPPAVYQSKIDAIMARRETADLAMRDKGPAVPAKPGTNNNQPYSDAEEVIQRQCASEWPDDFNMHAHCIRQQQKTLASLKAGVPADIPVTVFAKIREKCAAEWPKDYSMRLHCEKQQMDAYRELHQSR